MLSKKLPFWKKKDRGSLPIEASAMEANASGKVPAQSAAPTPTSQPAQQATPATPTPAPQPAASASVPQSVQQSKPATPAPAPKKEQPKTTAESQTIHSNGPTEPGFESSRTITKICDMLDVMKSELTGKLADYEKELNAQKDSLEKLESKSAGYHGRLETLEGEMKKIKEQLAQQPASVPTSKLVSTTSASALSAAGRVPDGDGVGYYFLNSNEGKWQYTWNVNVADQLSNGQWQKCYVSWKKGAFSGWLDETAIKKLLGGSPRDGIHKTYVYWVPDDRDQRYHWDQAAAYQLSGSYAASELLYTIEYWWWKDGAPERQLTKEEFERNHLG